jgi:hypothetical protein
MPEVVDAELVFEAVRRAPERREHDACVVDQQLQPGRKRAQALCRRAHAGQRAELERHAVDPGPGLELPQPRDRLVDL